MTEPVLNIEDLHLSFPVFRGEVHALNHVSLEIGRGEIVGVVGESGSGKSVTAMLAMRLLPEGSYRIHHGQVMNTVAALWQLPYSSRSGEITR